MFDFHSFRKNSTAASLICTILGVILFLKPGGTLSMISQIAGTGAAIAGVLTIRDGIRRKREGWGGSGGLLGGIVILLVGCWLVFNPQAAASILPQLIGIVILGNGIINLMDALSLRKTGYSRWTMSLVLAILTILFGLAVLSNPFGYASMLVRLMGAAMIYNGLSNLWIVSRF